MSTSVGEIALDLVLNSEEFETRVGEIAKKTADSTKQNSGFADSLNKVGSASTTVGTALLGISAPITGIGIASTKSALTFEDSMAKVMTIADQTEMSYDDMKSAIMDLSSQTGISANEIADNVYNAISAGQKTGDAVNFVSNSTKLAKAGFADAGAALDILTTILNAYGMEASEVTNVSDMLIQTQNKGKVTVGELSTAMGKVIPTANANNVALDQLCSGYAIMTANGVACAESTTYMNSMLNELGKSGTTVSNILKSETGMSFSECMASGMSLGDVLAVLDKNAKDSGLAFTDLWGSAEAGKAGLILLGDSGKEFNSMLEEMESSSGATEQAFQTLDTTSYNMQKALNEVKNAGIQLGGTLLETLAPVIMNVCNAVSKACEWFNNLDEGTKKTIFAVSGIVTAIGGALVVFGKIATGISSVITAVKTVGTVFSGLSGVFTALNPTVLIVVGVIGALIAIGVLLYKNWDTIKQKATEIWGAICDFFSQTWESIKAGATAAWTAISEFFGTVWETIKELFSTVLGIIETIWRTKWELVKTVALTIFNAIKTFFVGWFNMVKTVVMTQLNLIKNYFMTIFNAIKTVVTNVVNTIKTIIQTVFTTIKTIIQTILNTIKSVVSNIFNAIKALIRGDVNGAKEAVKSAFSAMKSGVSTILNAMKGAVSNIFNAIKSGISSTVSGIKDTIVNGFNNAFSYIKSIPSQALQWGKDMIMGIVNGIRSCIGAVGDAVADVASKIKSYLHFSVPDVGPLTDYESWMPDFMKGLAKGISKNKSLVANAVSDLSATMSENFQTPNLKVGFETPKLRYAGRSDLNNTATENSEMFGKLSEMYNKMMSANSDNGDIIIPVYIGGNIIDEIVVKAQDRRKLRSGGMA